MKRELTIGETCSYQRMVQSEDVAAFHNEIVHSVYSTFSMARDAEFTTRQFILEIIDEDEEGIGTSLSIKHVDSAFVGDTILFTGKVLSFSQGRLHCSWEAKVGDRMIAFGETGQKLLKKEALERLLVRRKKL